MEGLAIIRDDRVVYAGRSFAAMFGATEADLCGRPWTDLFTAASPDYGRFAWPDLASITRWDGKAHGHAGNGSLFEAELHLVKSPGGDWVLHAVNTTAEQAEARELARRSAELERATRMKTHFLASMSHELRTPLAGILGLAEVLREGIYGELQPKQLEAVRAVEDSGRHLLGLINDILDLTKIEADQVVLERKSVALAPLADAAMRMIKSPAAKKCIQTRCTVNPPDLTADLDPTRFKQILVNLLDNAIKFTPVGGTVSLTLDGTRDTVTFVAEVQDSGCGIDSADFRRIFLPFEQSDQQLARAYGGAGLGLPLVLRLAELHGGGVSVSSARGQGSTFTVTLPRGEPGASTSPADTTEDHADTPAAPLPTGTRIAVIEDNPVTSKLLCDFLNGRGCRCEAVLNSPKALETCRTFQPELVLMDIQMPVIDGFELTGLFRASGDPALAAVPIIALTALAMPGDRERCLAAGMNDYLPKPFRLHDVYHALARALAAKA
jgi:signal transduction histidine kinase/CheY-like chemotaxis protein